MTASILLSILGCIMPVLVAFAGPIGILEARAGLTRYADFCGLAAYAAACRKR